MSSSASGVTFSSVPALPSLGRCGDWAPHYCSPQRYPRQCGRLVPCSSTCSRCPRWGGAVVGRHTLVRPCAAPGGALPGAALCSVLALPSATRLSSAVLNEELSHWAAERRWMMVDKRQHAESVLGERAIIVTRIVMDCGFCCYILVLSILLFNDNTHMQD